VNPIGDLNLVPATGMETIGTAFTSPPFVDPDHKFQPGYNSGDATAMSSQEYMRMTQQPPPALPPSATVDPLSIQPPPVAPRPKPRPAPPQPVAAPTRTAERREAVPLSQPLPDIKVDRDVTVRLNLTIGADGRVKEVDVLKGGRGVTARVISKVQGWRFKPATEDGRPVESQFPVEIFFNGP
jgi:protein TonB